MMYGKNGLKTLYIFYFSLDCKTVFTIVRDWFFSIYWLNKKFEKKNFYFKILVANQFGKTIFDLEKYIYEIKMIFFHLSDKAFPSVKNGTNRDNLLCSSEMLYWIENIVKYHLNSICHPIWMNSEISTQRCMSNSMYAHQNPYVFLAKSEKKVFFNNDMWQKIFLFKNAISFLFFNRFGNGLNLCEGHFFLFSIWFHDIRDVSAIKGNIEKKIWLKIY